MTLPDELSADVATLVGAITMLERSDVANWPDDYLRSVRGAVARVAAVSHGVDAGQATPEQIQRARAVLTALGGPALRLLNRATGYALLTREAIANASESPH